jgi:hypothetical protein
LDEEHIWRAAFSGYSFLAAAKRVTGSKGFESKTAWRRVSAAHALKVIKGISQSYQDTYVHFGVAIQTP